MKTLSLENPLHIARNYSRSTTYTIAGPPISWVRVSPNFKSRKLYDVQKNVKMMVGIELASQHEGDLFDGPLRIDWHFFMEFPSNIKKRKPHMIGKPHIIKPDISNLVKFYEDTAKGILFKDDCLIAQGYWEKIYDENPRTEFTITKL